MYGCVVGRKDHLVRKEGGGFDAQEYEEFPERYASVFSIKVSRSTGIDHDDIQKKIISQACFYKYRDCTLSCRTKLVRKFSIFSSVFLKC